MYDRNKPLTRISFASKLSENIKNNSNFVTNAGGNVVIAVINNDFTYELAEIFNETIIDMLLSDGKVNFDQFGKYEIKTQPVKRVKSIFTDNKEIFLPELKMIRFHPAQRLKERIRGEVFRRVKRTFLLDDDDEKYDEDFDDEDDELYDEEEDITEEENIIEGEENNGN